MNIVYTDYIRLVLSYLEDVLSFKPYMSLDILTRIPINYIERIINVYLFNYSTMFDMLLGALFLTLIYYIFAKYIGKKIYIFILILLFLYYLFHLINGKCLQMEVVGSIFLL